HGVGEVAVVGAGSREGSDPAEIPDARAAEDVAVSDVPKHTAEASPVKTALKYYIAGLLAIPLALFCFLTTFALLSSPALVHLRTFETLENPQQVLRACRALARERATQPADKRHRAEYWDDDPALPRELRELEPHGVIVDDRNGSVRVLF